MKKQLALVISLALIPALWSQEIILRPEMVTAGTEKAINNGVKWLASQQSANGSWSAKYPCVMTSLAGLALMANGNTPTEGPHAKKISKAIDFLLKQADNTGLITTARESTRSMYGHGFAMLFLGQAYGMEKNHIRQKQIERVLEKAITLTQRSQSNDGGWLYRPEQNSDEGSVTITQIQGLRSCRNGGLKVPKKVIENAVKYIAKCSNKDGGISYSLRNKGNSLPAITAAAVATLYNGGQYDDPVAEKALKYIQGTLAKNNDPMQAIRGHAYYAQFYISQAMWFSGDKNFKDYYPKIRNSLLKLQKKNGAWKGDYVGDVYGTSIALTILQIPYKNLPILQR